MTSRVLHVIPALAARYGGPSAATIGMCESLRSAGIDTLVATTDADGPGRLDVSTDGESRFHGIPVRFFARQASESFKWSRPLGRWLSAHCRDFDVVHIHAVFSHSSIAAGRACRAHGVPYLVRPLGTLDPWSLQRHAWRKRLLLQLGVRSLLAGAGAMHYTSDEEARLAESALPWLPRRAVVPLGVDEELFAGPLADTQSESPYILALSRLDRKKGIEVLIDAFHHVAALDVNNRWSLVIAGDGNPAYVESLQALASIGPGSKRITFRGWVAGADRVALLRGASLFALPSYQENFGIAMVEALAAGVPVMVAPGVNLGAEIEAAGAGWVVSRDRSVWRHALLAVTADDRERQTRGAKARDYANRFRWTAVAQSLAALYCGLTSTRVAFGTAELR
jgi:glycosyltransferase involved in cell wall biosynthesis